MAQLKHFNRTISDWERIDYSVSLLRELRVLARTEKRDDDLFVYLIEMAIREGEDRLATKQAADRAMG